MSQNKTIHFNEFEDDEYELTEEEMDELYRPKKQNNRKHTLPLFVYLILKSKSSSDNKLSQSQIIGILRDEYELEIERKSLSRTIHDLEDEHLGIFSNKTGGAWYDPYE